jgi:hypothetical protein
MFNILTIKEMKMKTTQILPHPSQNGHHQENKQQQTLARSQGRRTLIHCWWGCKLVQPLWRLEWRLLRKLKLEVKQKVSMIEALHVYV